MKAYQLYLFDADETLFDFRRAEGAALAIALRSFGIACTDAILACYHDVNDALWKQLEVGRITRDVLKWTRFQQLADAMQLSLEPHTANDRFMAALATRADLIDGAVDVCRALAARGKTLCIISNGTTSVQRPRFARSGLAPCFHTLFLSEEIGAAKPDPRFFDAVFQAFPQVAHSEMLVIGDSLTSDIAGGLAVGLDTCWFHPTGAPAPVQPKPTFSIRSLTELLTAL